MEETAYYQGKQPIRMAEVNGVVSIRTTAAYDTPCKCGTSLAYHLKLASLC